MATNRFWLFVVVIVIVVVGAAWYVLARSGATALAPAAPIGGEKDANGCLVAAGYSWCSATQTCIRPWETYCTAAAPKVATFACDGEKTITATFYPTDDKFVDLVLGGGASDGMKISLPHAMSGSGARYAKPDESIVFWNKGDTAFITQNGTTTFANCTIAAQ